MQGVREDVRERILDWGKRARLKRCDASKYVKKT